MIILHQSLDNKDKNVFVNKIEGEFMSGGGNTCTLSFVSAYVVSTKLFVLLEIHSSICSYVVL